MFWTREIAGWLLIILGLITFWLSYSVLLKNQRIMEAGPQVLMGIIIFRGGIHLLKVAVAARICQEHGETPKQDKARLTVARRVSP